MHRKRKVVKAAAITGLTLVMTTGFALASIGTGTVTADSLRLRSQANTNSATLTFAPRDSVVTLLEELDGWYKVSYDDQVGYMSADWLKVSHSSSEIVMGLGTVTTDTLDIRSGAGLVFNSLGVLYKDASVIILEDCGNGWYKVSGAGCIGYVSAECVEVDNNRGSAIDTEPVGTGTVNVTCMDVRFGPGNGYSSIGYLYSKEPVSILKDCGNGWYQIAYGSGSAYVRADYITRNDIEAGQEDADATEAASQADATQAEDQEAASQTDASDNAKTQEAAVSVDTASSDTSSSENSFTAYVTEALNVRSGAGTDYSRLGVLYAGNSVTVLEEANGWYKISYQDGVGYVSTEYISKTLDFANFTSDSSSSSESSSSNITNSNAGSSSNSNTGSSSNNNSNSNVGSAPASSVGAQAVELAKAQLGKPYVYGAAGPNGFDCSGLFYYIFNQLGVPIARGSSNQYYSSGTFVSVDEMQPGDLVYLFDPRFDSSGGTLPTTHVMMYIGDNTVIHASTTSYTVQCDTLFGGYYGNYVVAVKRMG